MRLHLGCGTVYLEGYLNIDSSNNPQATLSFQRPDLVEKWKTTRNQYYSKQGELNLSAVTKREFVADGLFDITDLPFPSNSVEEILVVQTFEHFSCSQIDKALRCWYDILVQGGFVDIYVPDIQRSIDLFIDSDTRQRRIEVARLIFGTRKGDLFYHHYGYEPEGLEKILLNHGFKNIVKEESSMHAYPSFRIRGSK
jgi:hypothetical protein